MRRASSVGTGPVAAALLPPFAANFVLSLSNQVCCVEDTFMRFFSLIIEMASTSNQSFGSAPRECGAFLTVAEDRTQ